MENEQWVLLFKILCEQKKFIFNFFVALHFIYLKYGKIYLWQREGDPNDGSGGKNDKTKKKCVN